MTATPSLLKIQNHALNLGTKLVPLLIVAIHFSTAATLILSILIAVLWLVSGYIRNTNVVVQQNPVVLFGLLLFVWLAISISYSSAPLPSAINDLLKYRKFWLLLILVPFIISGQNRYTCEKFLLTALFASLFISLAGYFDLLSEDLAKHLMKNRITHSLFMAFLGFYCLHKLHEKNRYHWLWLSTFALVTFNLFVATNGRTGQLIFLVLCGLFFLQVFSFRTGLIAICIVLIAFTLFLFYSPSAGRIWDGINQSIDFYHHNPDAEGTSIGYRLRFWSNALTIIGQSPWLGEGVGGFSYKFQELFPQYPILRNPHNEYLLITAQLGLPGLCLFLAFIMSILRQAYRLPLPERRLLQGIWVMLCISCLFNSSLFDHTEGNWFMLLIILYSSPLIGLQNAQRHRHHT